MTSLLLHGNGRRIFWLAATLAALPLAIGCGRSDTFGSSPQDCPPAWLHNGSCVIPHDGGSGDGGRDGGLGDGGHRDGGLGDGGHHDGGFGDGGHPQDGGTFGDLGPCPPICAMNSCPAGLGCCACNFCQTQPVCTTPQDGGTIVPDGGIDCGNPMNCTLPACVGDPRCHVLGTEICNNGVDDNDNGLIDCADPACANFPGCQTMHMCPTPPVCTDPTCVNAPACQNLQCHPTVDFGTLQPTNSSSTKMVNTAGTTAPVTTACAPAGGGMVVGQFTLSGPAAVTLTYSQGSGEDHVFSLYHAGINQSCAADPVDNACYDPSQAPTGVHTYSNLEAGNYYVIVQSFEPLGVGPVTVTLSTETTKEICNNGIDDNGNGLIDCADPDCFTAPNCVSQECNPDINVGTLVANGTPASISFNTTSGNSSQILSCEAATGGQDVVVQFTLAQAAGLRMDWDQTGDHVVGLFYAPPAGEPCDQSQRSCFDPSGASSDSVVWTELAAGTYELIFKATSPGDEGHIDATLSAFAYSGVELCNNGIDDNNNGLVDCADPQCFGIDGCTGPYCMPDTQLGDIEVGQSREVMLNLATNGKNGYSTKCSQGGGKAQVIQFSVASPGPSGGIGIGFDCSYTGSEVIDLHQDVDPRDLCSANDIVCADLATLPFGCGYEVPNLQPGTFNVIVQAFEPGEEGQMDLTISVNDDRQLVNCGAGGNVCSDRRCATSPFCTLSACVPEQTIDPLALTGKDTFALLQTATEGVHGTLPCATAPGGQTAALEVHLTAAADLTLSYQQVGNHAVGLYPVQSAKAPCDAAPILACQPAIGANTSGMATFTNVPAGYYYVLVAGDQPDTGTTQYSGSVEFIISGMPH